MDFHCIEALLNLLEFRVTAQVLGPKYSNFAQISVNVYECIR